MRNARMTDGLTVITSIVVIGFVIFEVSALGALVLRPSRAHSSSSPSLPAPPIRGQSMSPLLSIDFSARENTMLFVLSTRCRYCAESAAFYRALLSERSRFPNIRFVAVCLQAQQECARYLRTSRLEMDEVVSLSNSPSRQWLSGTPLLILVSREGLVRTSWLGLLSPSDEDSIQATLSRTNSD
jgi:hypothetical protein